MTRHLRMAFGNALEGLDDDFNRWYNDTHLGQILEIPGYMAAQRFELSSTQVISNPPYKCVALYEVETDDLARTSDDLMLKPREELPVTHAWDYDNCATWWYTPITDRVVQAAE